jgi:hypothetical protein
MTNFVRRDIDGKVFLMMTLGMNESDIDAHFEKKIDSRKLPVKIATYVVLFLACLTTLLFFFTGILCQTK